MSFFVIFLWMQDGYINRNGGLQMKLAEKKEMKTYQDYRRFLRMMLCIAMVTLFTVWLLLIWFSVPKKLHIQAGETQQIDFKIPCTGEVTQEVSAMSALTDTRQVLSVDLGQPVVFHGNEVEEYRLHVKLFGIIPFKTSEVSVIQNTKLMPVGKPIGIYVKTIGLLVLETSEFQGENNEIVAPAVSLLKPGDYILKMNGEETLQKKEFMEKISQSDGSPIILTISRNQEVFDLKITPGKNENGEYKLGIWIRDNAQGVGTMTFIDENNHFGALGHGINDVDTSTLMELKNGSLYRTDIISVKKGASGTPGELTGLIAYSDENRIGEITDNSKEGIFGTVSDKFKNESEQPYMDIALKQEVTTGPAKILCSVDNTTKYYDAEITAIHLDNDNINRGIELKITDEELLSKTGGIVQGMSGSPVIQNGKIIGAVTHVLVSNPEKGYAIFIENMLLLR